jgi:hypothetical protein
MPVPIPDWLSKHGGHLQPAANGHGVMVYFDNEPQYFIIVRPVAGRFGREVTQTINGKRLESNRIYDTDGEAIRGGLEDLRDALGW